MAAISHISTIARVAKILGRDEDELHDLAYDQLEPEDGLIWVLDDDDHITIALSDHAIEMLKEILEELKQPSQPA